ncbi:hypothetical protein ACVI1N_004824 [Sinorhizobium medicae]
MYAAAQVKPKSFEAEHLGPAPISGPHLVPTYKAGREIYAQGDLSDKCYQVSTGAVRVYRLLSDGRRQVVSFHLPGEMFGFEAGPGQEALLYPACCAPSLHQDRNVPG